MNRSAIKKQKQKSPTNYRILIQRKTTKDDGEGYAPTEAEALKHFNSILKQISKFEFAELWYEGKLVKKV